MSETNAATSADEPFFHALLMPHRSLGRRGFAILMGTLLFGWLVTGVSDVWPRVLMVLLGGIVIAQAGLLARRLYPGRTLLPVYTAWSMTGFWYFFLFDLQVMYELPLAVAVLGGLLALCRRDGDAWRPWWPGLALAIGMVAGLAASARAARLDPVEALRRL